jgi:tetratricopeptide (TPR) repeat protein
MNWLGIARNRGDFKEILAERLKRNKFDLAALRAQFDSAIPEEQKRLTQEYLEIAESHPDNPDLQYLKFRTIPHAADHIEKTIGAYKVWPDNFWLCNAAGRSYLRQGDFQSAEECFRKQIARNTPFYDHATVELARLRRFQSNQPTTDLRDLRDSLALEILLDTETGKNVFGTPLEGYYLMHQGKVAEARKLAEEKKDQRLMLLSAMSKGAEPAWLDEAFAMPVDELTDGGTRMYLAAIASRRGLPYEQYLEVEREEERNEMSRALRLKMQRWLSQKVPASKTEFLNEDFKGLLPIERGVLIQAWLLFAPDQFDESLHRAAKSLLFSQERPYLGDDSPVNTAELN